MANSSNNNSNNNNNNNDGSLAACTTSSPCEHHRGTSIYIPGLSLIHDGGRVLFQPTPNISSDLSLLHGRVTGLVGTNGSGKSSTAKLLAASSKDCSGGILDGFPTDGFVVEYLTATDDDENYNSKYDHDDIEHYLSMNTLRPIEYIRSRLEDRINNVRRDIEKLDRRLSSSSTTTTQDQNILEHVAEELSDLYHVEERMIEKMEREIDRAMIETGLDAHANKALEKLSCGWRYKCRLIASVLTHPEMLIIDEPSFLDEKSAKWLVESLRNMARVDNCIVLLISHKEKLLDATCDRIVHINSASQTLTTFPCGYSEFRIRLESEISRATKTVDDTQYQMDKAEKQLNKLQTNMNKKRGNLKKTFNSRGYGKVTKTQICADLGTRVEKCQKSDKAAASKLRRTKRDVNEIKEVGQRAKRERVKPITIEGMPAADKTIVNLESVGFRYHDDDDDKWVFQNVDTTLESKDRVLLEGPNGAGKSTLVELIIGGLGSGSSFVPTEGYLRRKTENILYFPQTALRDLLRDHGNQSATEFIMASSSSSSSSINDKDDNDDKCLTANTATMTRRQARNHLARMGLDKDLVFREIRRLSSGQRVRLWLAYELLRRPNPSLLILDEVSENVDKETRDSLVDLFESFDGAVLVVSHDPDFCRSCSFTKTWTLHRHGLRVSFPS